MFSSKHYRLGFISKEFIVYFSMYFYVTFKRVTFFFILCLLNFVNTFFQKNQKFFRVITFNAFDYRKGLAK